MSELNYVQRKKEMLLKKASQKENSSNRRNGFRRLERTDE